MNVETEVTKMSDCIWMASSNDNLVLNKHGRDETSMLYRKSEVVTKERMAIVVPAHSSFAEATWQRCWQFTNTNAIW